MWGVCNAYRALDVLRVYDAAFRPGATVYLWVSVFDRTQTRHSRHVQPVAVELMKLGGRPPPRERRFCALCVAAWHHIRKHLRVTRPGPPWHLPIGVWQPIALAFQ